MEETEVSALPEHLTPQFELEQADQYSQFLLHSKSEILAVLRSLIQKGAMITVHFDQGRSFLLTTMLSLKSDNREFVLDIGSNEAMNAKALQAEKLILTTIIDKVKVQFSVKKLSPTQHEGRTAFLGTLPETLLRLQRREYFRLSTPLVNPVKLNAIATRPDHSAFNIELPLLDVSGGGVGLMATLDHAQLFERGTTLTDCKMMLPEEGLLVVTLSVRNLFDVTTRSGAHYVRMGCEFVNLSGARLNMVQRYITRVERERKARLSGMA